MGMYSLERRRERYMIIYGWPLKVSVDTPVMFLSLLGRQLNSRCTLLEGLLYIIVLLAVPSLLPSTLNGGFIGIIVLFVSLELAFNFNTFSLSPSNCCHL